MRITLLFLFSVTCCAEWLQCNEANIFRSIVDKFIGHCENGTEHREFPHKLRETYKEKVREMFDFGYNNYLTYAFPLDELNPVDCVGRTADHYNPDNININDVLGDYSLTLIESLNTLAIMGNVKEFRRASKLVIDTVSFDKTTTVQVFEATIRVIGSLISSHLLITDKLRPFGDLTPDGGYADELLTMAHDLAARLLPAFDNTGTGIPYPRVNLRRGVLASCRNETCTAGAGTLLLEFGVLSRLLADPTYEAVARRAVDALWSHRNRTTGLLGSTINIQTGRWTGTMAGTGAGLDSFYEYLLKAYILFGDRHHLAKFDEVYASIRRHMRRGRPYCSVGAGTPPIYVNVDMHSGETVNRWIDSLAASWPSVQVLYGDLSEAVCSHALYYALWKKYGVLPERFNWEMKQPVVKFYPLRPELVESTYHLYRATHNPFYLHVGAEIVENLNRYAKARCGYATIHDVTRMNHEDRMESFFLSETCKYLYLLFDEPNPVNADAERYLFTTEGHILPVSRVFRDSSSEFPGTPSVDARWTNVSSDACAAITASSRMRTPVAARYMHQYHAAVGLYDD